MSWKASGLCFVTIALAGGFGLATVGRAAAETATNKCALEWKAAKANGTTGGKSWKEFFDQCGTDQNGLSRSITLTPAEEPKPAAADATPAPTPAPAPATAAVAPAAAAPVAPVGKAEPPVKATATPRQFATEAEAKAKCPANEVVWLNATTRIFHFAGHQGYGKTEKGAYMCQADATAAGARAAKNEKPKKNL